MKAKIDKAGFLWLERPRPEGPRMERAGCPRGRKVTCGDYCVLFGEPVIKGQEVEIGICDGTWILLQSDFKDYRKVE